MAVTYGFYNALNHDRVYDAIQMSSIFDGIIRDGVFSTIGEALVCKASENGLVVNVGSGRAWFNHTWTLNDTDYPVEAEEAEVVLDRIDAIVLEVNQAVEVRANSIKFVKGTPSSNPVRPTLIHNAEVNQYALAYVSIRAGQTTIFQADITNVIGTEETPFITGLMQQVSIDTLLTQWADEFNQYFTNFQTLSTREFNTWMAAKVAQYTAWYAQMETDMDADFAEFDAWFQHMKDQLDSDAAGHLQAEIDALALQAEKGSIVKVVTTDSSLFNKPVTINQGLFSRTSTFDANGVADFESIPYIGNDIQITATNGTLTAESIVTIPYFGKYEFDLEFWAAILDISTENSGLYNRTITITKDGSPVGTTTFNGSGKAIFSVHSAGTYILSATSTGGSYFETSVEVTEETTYQITLGDVPDGATALPTDDIQIWIKCAGLVSDCTTLAEVLENEDLFDALLRDSNACKYLARSTTWAVAEGQVPTMTDDTHPSGEVSASSYNSSGFNPYKAFNTDSNGWLPAENSSFPQWIQYEFPSAVIIRSIYILSIGIYSSGFTRTFKVQASNDGVNFTDISDTLSNYLGDGVGSYYSFKNNTSYKYYRVSYLSISSGSITQGNGMKFQFYEDASITQNEDAMRRVGKYSYCKNQLMGNEDWAEAIVESPYILDFMGKGEVPVMTSNTTPSGICIASSVYDNSSVFQPWLSFKNNINVSSALSNGFWLPTDADSQTEQAFIAYQFTSAKKINTIKIHGFYAYHTTGDSTVKNIKVIARNDSDGNYTELATIPVTFEKKGDTSVYVSKDIILNFDNDTAYERYGIKICWDFSRSASPIVLQIYDIQMYLKNLETNLIHSAPNDTIYYKNGDTPVTLCTTDENGVGELDFSTLPKGNFTFYSSVAKDPENLTEDYPRNLILTKTPMGGTTEVYMMPNAIRTLYWNGYEDDNLEDVTTANGWTYSGTLGGTISHNTGEITLTSVSSVVTAIGTKKPISISNGYKAVTKGVTNMSGYGAIGAQSTKNLSTSIGTAITITSDALSKADFAPVNQNGYPIVYTNNGRVMKVYALYYAKRKLANLISAACDMVYYYDSSNNKRILAITDEFGFAQVDFSALPAGNLTLYSSVAKNPDDLSQPFSKIVNINPSQPMKVVLAPVNDVEKLLYWYGYQSDDLEDLSTTNGWPSSPMSYLAPTHNARDISTSSTAYRVYCGVGNKVARTMSKVSIVVQGIQGTTIYGQYGASASKDYTFDGNTGNITSSSLQKLDLSFTSGSKYFSIYGYENKNFKLSALWYE